MPFAVHMAQMSNNQAPGTPTVKVVLVTPKPSPTSPEHLTHQVESATVLPQDLASDLLGWVSLTTTEQLAFPLKVSRQGARPAVNHAVDRLCHDMDITSSRFLSATGPFMSQIPDQAPEFACASFLVARKDGKDLSPTAFMFVSDYVGHIADKSMLTEYPMATEEGKRKTVEVIARMMAPHAFAYHADQHRQVSAALGRQSWSKDEIPVAITEPVCGACSRSKTAPGVQLLICSKCQIRHYCSKECQKEDWKAHKKACAKIKAAKDAKDAGGTA